MEAQVAAWGAAVTVPLILNVFTRQGSDALGFSAILVFIWVLGRVFAAVWTVPDSMAMYPLIDMLAGMTAFRAWQTQPERWKLVLTALYVGQCASHVAFWQAWPLPGSLLRYLWVLNSLFALQLICVAWPGGSRVAHLLFAWVSHRPGLVHHTRG